MRLLTFILFASIVGLAVSQSLVLVGGGLTDGNAAVWDKVVEQAVRTSYFKNLFHKYHN